MIPNRSMTSITMSPRWSVIR